MLVVPDGRGERRGIDDRSAAGAQRAGRIGSSWVGGVASAFVIAASWWFAPLFR